MGILVSEDIQRCKISLMERQFKELKAGNPKIERTGMRIRTTRKVTLMYDKLRIVCFKTQIWIYSPQFICGNFAIEKHEMIFRIYRQVSTLGFTKL